MPPLCVHVGAGHPQKDLARTPLQSPFTQFLYGLWLVALRLEISDESKWIDRINLQQNINEGKGGDVVGCYVKGGHFS
jgi:hypothetical protein